MNAQIPELYEWFKAGGKGEYQFRTEDRRIEHTFCAYGYGWNNDKFSDRLFVCDNVYYSADNDGDKNTLWIDIMPNEIRIDSTYYDLGFEINIDPGYFSTECGEDEIFQYITANDIGFLDADTLEIVVKISRCL